MLSPQTGLPFVSHAQNGEDVRLWKALRDAPERMWIDIGAGHPYDLSVTQLFSERGWTGINVEPGVNFKDLVQARPADINIQAVVSKVDGLKTFYSAEPYPDLSSINVEAFKGNSNLVKSWSATEAESLTLATLVRKYVIEPIGFLKIDVEGAEKEVLESSDWTLLRPPIVVVEAIDPVALQPSHEAWEGILLSEGYEFVVFDGINRFYLRTDRPELRSGLAAPVVAAIDGFVTSAELKSRSLVLSQQQLLDETRAQVDRESERLTTAFDEINVLRAELAKAKDDADVSVVRLIALDRREKLGRVELDSRARAIGSLTEANRQLAGEAQHFQDRVVEMESTWTWRVGRRVVGLGRPFSRVLRPFAAQALRLVRLWRSRPAVVQREYRDLTQAGRPLATVVAVSQTDQSVGATDDGVANLVQQMLAARPHGPLPLSRGELEEVRRLADVGDNEVVSRLALIREPLRREGSQDVLVIDIRTAQLPVPCGSRTHARNVLKAVLQAVPDGVRVEALTDPARPPLPAELRERFDDVWHRDRVHEVGAFFQLAPFDQFPNGGHLDLLRVNGVKRAMVWLDAIPFIYPKSFLKVPETYLQFQLGVEAVSRADHVLALSRSSAAEAMSIVPMERISVTGCLGDSLVTSVSDSADRRSRPNVLLIGNGLPHKGLAAGVAAFSYAAQRLTERVDLVVVASTLEGQIEDMSELAARLGLDPGRITFRSLLTDPELADLLATAQCLIVPSHHEGYSLPPVEALEVGTPVVLSDISAHRELLGDGNWWFPPGDPVKAGEALLNVLRATDQTLTAQLQQRTSQSRPDLVQVVAKITTDICAGLTPRTKRMAPLRRSETPLSLNKICELEDFSHSRLEPVIRKVFSHEQLRLGTSFPEGFEYRKYWEIAMAILTFESCGLLDGTHRFLGIGAGNEPTIFHLTNRAAEVIATDLYLTEDWEESANSSMLTEPDWHWPFSYRPDRLKVQHMDAMNLEFDDESISGIFSSSSIEHFGDRDQVNDALEEMFRVLEPGGVLSIASEFRLGGNGRGIPGALLFDEDDLREIFVGQRGWSLVEPFDGSVSPATLATEAQFLEVLDGQNAQTSALGGLWTYHIRYERYPHIVLRHDGFAFTSFHLALQKDR